MSFAARFWAKVDVREPQSCWRWQASKTKNGYGKLNDCGRIVSAHRVAYELARGAVPAGMDVLHRCDKRQCVNPAHLFLGTKSDNMVDMLAKGRHPNVKLNRSVVARIAFLLNAGIPQLSIAELVGLSQKTVSRVKLGKYWFAENGRIGPSPAG